MAKTREIKGRMKAVGNIQRITKTMQMIATARFQASQRRATEAKPYTEKIAELVQELAVAASGTEAGSSDTGRINHPLLCAPDPAVNRRLLLVITSNRGLCGGYNASILRTAAAFLRDHENDQIDLEVVGKKGLGYFRFAGTPVASFHSQFTDTPAYDLIEQLANGMMDRFIQGQYDAIHVCYMEFLSMARQKPKVLELLPLRPPTAETTGSGRNAGSVASADKGASVAGGSGSGGGGGTTTYEYSPDSDQLLGELLPVTVKTQLFQCFNEANVGEHIARMVAMKSATDAAGKMRRSLTRQFNRARQTAITTELSEIIGGAAALQ